jgi:hypothetical protein
MDIEWYKNKYHLASISVVIIIIIIGLLSSGLYSVGIITNQASVKIISTESLYRIFFNPLWALFIWLHERGLKLNAERHKDILQNIQGALDSSRGKTIEVNKLCEMIYRHDDAEARIEARLIMEDTIKNGQSNINPTI